MKANILISAFLLNLFSSISLVLAQGITTHDVIFQPNIPKPQKGVPYTDPKFGTRITRITDARTNGYPGEVPQYSKRQAWNSDESLMLIFTGSGEVLLYNGQTYEFIKTLDYLGGEDVFWHPTNPDIIYYSWYNTLRQYNNSTGEDVGLHTFNDYTFANTCGEGNLSDDGRYWAFAGVVYNDSTQISTFKDIVVYDIINDSIVSKMALPDSLSDFDWVSISPLGNYVVIDYASLDTGRYKGVEVYDRNLHFLWQKPLGFGHSDVGTDSKGNEILVLSFYDSVSNESYITKYNLSDGAETRLINHAWYEYDHISCRNTANKGWCLVSTYDGEGRLTDDSLTWTPFEDEIFEVNLDTAGLVRRLAHHHSRRFSPSTPNSDSSMYFAEPHATISRTGTRVLFASNWRQNIEQDSSVDAYIIDMRTVGVNDDYTPEPDIKLGCYPEPFSSELNINININKPEFVTLKVYNLLGNEIATIANDALQQGIHSYIYKAENLPSGIYILSLQAGSKIITHKIILIRD
ncbi:MAG: T9SS type A sorting domain-containing protein [FCB group bacterium]